jgi:hypothetical protein
MSAASPRTQPGPPSTNPRLPADHGLPALGMICHASLNLATIILTMLWLANIATLARVDDRLPAIGVLIIGFVRANLHRLAAEAMLDRSPAVPRLVRRYGVAALASTAAMALILHLLHDDLPLPFYLAFAVVSLYWPATLLLLTSRGDLKRTFEAADTFDLPLIPADRSLEGVGVLMIAFSSLGLGALAVAAILLFGPLQHSIDFAYTFIAFLLLAARGVFHLVTGIQTLIASSAEAFARFTGRYLVVALVTLVAAMVPLYYVSGARFSAELLASMILSGYLLLFWPLSLKRFARRLEVAPDETNLVAHEPGPAPDRGLTALGYLLVTIGVTSVALNVGARTGALGLGGLLTEAASGIGVSDLLDLTYAVAASYAGLALIGMTLNRRLAVYAYILVAVVVLVAELLLADAEGAAPQPDLAILFNIAAITVDLVPPILAAILIHRRLPPAAEVTPPRGTPAIPDDV